MKRWIKLLATTFAILMTCGLVTARGQLGTPAPAPDKSAAYNMGPLYQEVRQLARRYYPEATSHQLNDKIHFEYKTRVFIVHEPLLSGEWQDPWEDRGPERGGIHCDMALVRGAYQGQAAVPQSFDKRYFTLLLTAPYSKELNAHLLTHLKYPRNVPDGLLKELDELLNNFHRFISKPAPE